MAHRKKCPHCEKITDNQKKGMSGDNQRYKCNECGKQWTEGVTGNSTPAKKTPKKTAAPAKKTVQTQSGRTIIVVNNNTIRDNIKGKLSKEEALEIAGEYFKEIQKDQVEVKTVGDTITYTFKIQTGRKG